MIKILITSLIPTLVLLDTVLLLYCVHDYWFLEKPIGFFFLSALDEASKRIGQILIVVGVFLSIFLGLAVGPEELGRRLVNIVHNGLIGGHLKEKTYFLSFGCVVLVYIFFTGPRFYPKISQGSSAILITPDDAEMYIADKKRGKVLWQDLQAPHGDSFSIEIGQETGSGWTQGEPSRLVFLPQKSYRKSQIMVTDVKFNSIIFIDQQTKRVVRRISDVGFAPRSIVVTPDGRKAYIGSEQPIPTGSVAILDLTSSIPRLLDKRISVPSPEGMVIVGRRLYIPTQSGGGKDPVFIIDTVTDKVESWISGFAVGCDIAAIPPYGNKLYVARGNYLMFPDDKPKSSPLGVIKVGSWPWYRVTVSAPIPLDFNIPIVKVTKDGKTALVVNDKKITAIETEKDQVKGSSDTLSEVPDGLAISNNRVYVWLPNNPDPNKRVFTFDLRSLE